MSKYSVVMHELAEINSCLRNLDEAPKAQIKAVMRTRLFIQLAHIPHLALQPGAGSGRHQGLGTGVGLFAYSPVSL